MQEMTTDGLPFIFHADREHPVRFDDSAYWVLFSLWPVQGSSWENHDVTLSLV